MVSDTRMQNEIAMEPKPLFPPAAKAARGIAWRSIFKTGFAVVLVLFVLSQAVWPGTDICGHPARGRVAVYRGEQVLAVFSVAEAATAAQRRRGLMDCPALRPGTGMLFVYEDTRSRVFWMKNTPLALGIIFAAADGRITAIERGVPYSLNRIMSPGGVQYVLEINFQEAQGFQIGDRLHYTAP